MPRFGPLLREHRKRLGLTLRRFAENAAQDPAYISRIERGVLPPPKDPAAIEKLAGLVGLPEGSDERQAFIDVAAVDAGRLPEDLATDEALAQKLPLLFRTARGERPTREELEKLAEFLRDK